MAIPGPAGAQRRWANLRARSGRRAAPARAVPGPGPNGGACCQAPADELRRWRQRAGLSQARVAAASGLSRSTESHLEGGRRGARARGASWARLTRALARLAPALGAGALVEGDR